MLPEATRDEYRHIRAQADAYVLDVDRNYDLQYEYSTLVVGVVLTLSSNPPACLRCTIVLNCHGLADTGNSRSLF